MSNAVIRIVDHSFEPRFLKSYIGRPLFFDNQTSKYYDPELCQQITKTAKEILTKLINRD